MHVITEGMLSASRIEAPIKVGPDRLAERLDRLEVHLKALQAEIKVLRSERGE